MAGMGCVWENTLILEKSHQFENGNQHKASHLTLAKAYRNLVSKACLNGNFCLT